MPVSLLIDLLTHPERVTRVRLAGCAPADLAGAAEREQVVPQAMASLEQLADADDHRDAMRVAARRWALYEALQQRVIAGVLDAAPGVPMLFFKGAALAYSLYAHPAHRMRLDWDILIGAEHAAGFEAVLRARGFMKDLKVPGRIRVRQRTYRHELGEGECVIDLHTGMFNAPGPAARIRFEDLHARAVALPALHPGARGTSAADALVIACLHRLVHHSGDPRLIWDYDIHLLARVLQHDLPGVLQRAGTWHAVPAVARELARVAARFDTPLPAAAAGALGGHPADATGFARDNRSRADDFLLDWRALGWRDRAVLVRETFLPDADFVREASGSKLPLPVLYVRRLVGGAAAWFARPDRRRRLPPG